jgi:hypothetical protein
MRHEGATLIKLAVRELENLELAEVRFLHQPSD